MSEPRPAISCARPFEAASSVANSLYTRTGSWVLSTVTAVPSRMRLVRPAIVASMMLAAGVHHVPAVVLGDVERVDPDSIGEHRLLDGVSNHGIAAQFLRRPVHGDRHEGIQAELDVLNLLHGR